MKAYQRVYGVRFATGVMPHWRKIMDDAILLLLFIAGWCAMLGLCGIIIEGWFRGKR
jgi:hypothetical protein